MSFHKNSRFIVSLSSDIKDTSNRIATIGIEAIETCSSRKCAGLIQIMALSSVLQHTIYSVFLNYSHGIRPLFHGPILPRGTNLHPKCNTFYIMWSRCGKFDNKERAPTQEIGKFMKENKTNFENDPKGRRQMSSEIYKNVSSYLDTFSKIRTMIFQKSLKDWRIFVESRIRKQ